MSQIQIPKGWSIHSLEEICDIKAGFAEGKKDIVNGTIHLRMNNIDTEFRLNFDLIRTINPTKEQIEKYKLQKDDIIFNNTNSTALVGKSAFFNIDKVCLYSNHLTRLRVNNIIILPKWLLLYLQYLWHQRYFEKNCNKWVNQSAFNNEKIKNLQIPLPPLESQKKIVQKLDYILGQLEEKKKEIVQLINKFNSKKILNSYQNHLLNLAFSGKLTGEESVFSEEYQMEIPKGWELKKLEDVCSKITDGDHQTPPRLSSGVMMLTAKNVLDGMLDFSNVDYVSQEDYQKSIKRCNPEIGDILLSCVGSIGRNGIVREKTNFMLVRSVALLKPNEKILSKYLSYYLKSNTVKNSIKYSKTGSAIKSLYLKDIKKIPIVYPDKPTQQKIVQKLDDKLTEMKKYEQQITAIEAKLQHTKKSLDLLTSSVLNSAFSGKLVN